MKRLIIFLLIFSSLIACNKDDDQTIEEAINQLPAATQTGAGTFGCLVNGEPFVHNEGQINCFYQYVDGGYYFRISGNNFDYDYDIVSISLGTENKSIEQNHTYQVITRENGNTYGGGGIRVSPTMGETINTNENYTGELTITKLDFENFIVSGEFWFNVKHPKTGDTVKIREGRFDSQFYQ